MRGTIFTYPYTTLNWINLDTLNENDSNYILTNTNLFTFYGNLTIKGIKDPEIDNIGTYVTCTQKAYFPLPLPKTTSFIKIIIPYADCNPTKTYSLNLFISDTNSLDIQYKYTFTVTNTPTILLPHLSQFKPFYNGKPLLNQPSLTTSKSITASSLMISSYFNNQPGKFSLTISEISGINHFQYIYLKSIQFINNIWKFFNHYKNRLISLF